MELTNIQKYYCNKTILITGATGFLGKLVAEKLLRTCSGLNKIILTIRPKKNKATQERISEYFNEKLFIEMKKNNPAVLKKVEFVEANIEEEKLGLDDKVYELIKSANIIFHCATIVKFNASLKEAIIGNIITTKRMLDVARDINNLESFVHVSTCWANGTSTDERIVNLTQYKAEFFVNLIDNADDSFIDKMEKMFLKTWDCSYLLTKNVTENMVLKEKGDLPITIFRTPNVMPTLREPTPGWMNSMQIGTFITLGVLSGTINVLCIKKEDNSHFVPADLVSNGLVVVAWKTAMQKQNYENDLKVYNYTCTTNPISRGKYVDSCLNSRYPLHKVYRKPGYIATNKKWLFEIYFFIFNILPAFIFDIFLKIMGKDPKFMRMAQKTKTQLNTSIYFLTKNFKFETKNIPALWKSLGEEDKKLFDFDIDTVDWDEYIDVFTKSLKHYSEEEI